MSINGKSQVKYSSRVLFYEEKQKDYQDLSKKKLIFDQSFGNSDKQ